MIFLKQCWAEQFLKFYFLFPNFSYNLRHTYMYLFKNYEAEIYLASYFDQ